MEESGSPKAEEVEVNILFSYIAIFVFISILTLGSAQTETCRPVAREREISSTIQIMGIKGTSVEARLVIFPADESNSS